MYQMIIDALEANEITMDELMVAFNTGVYSYDEELEARIYEILTMGY